MSFFVNRVPYFNEPDKDAGDGQRAGDVNGGYGHGDDLLIDEWKEQNSLNAAGRATMSQKDKAFAHRVWPIVAELCGEGEGFDKPALHQSYDVDKRYCYGFTTSVYGQWADGIGERYVDDEVIKSYDEGLVYISKPPYTTYLLFSKGPDDQYEEPADDRTLPLNKDNIYGNLGDK